MNTAGDTAAQAVSPALVAAAIIPGMDVLLLSDLHGRLPDPASLPPAQLALIAGDCVPYGAVSSYPEWQLQAIWFRDVLGPWLEKLAARMPVVGIAGNHEFIAQMPYGERLLRSLAWTYLRDQSAHVAGLNIFGSPWSPRHPAYPSWAFQAEDDHLVQHWGKIDRGCDVLLVHGPPHGSRDKVAGSVHAGSLSLAKHLQRGRELGYAQPLVVCGHLHEQPGYDERSQVANSALATPAGAARKRVLMMRGAPDTGWKPLWHDLKLPATRVWLTPDVAEFTARLAAERLV